MSSKKKFLICCNRLAKKIAVFCVDCYRNWFAPMKIRTCRFYPTCSAYTKESIEKWGIIKGGIKGVCRILRCNPFSPGGYDPP